jgi:uncharacterized protein YbaP (TraB family)
MIALSFRLLALWAALWVVAPAAAQVPPACAGRNIGDELRAQAPARFEAAIARAAATPNAEGVLWRIERAGVAPSHLFGTLHVTDPRATDLPPPVRQALAAARVVAVELAEIGDQAAAQQLGLQLVQAALRPNGDSLAFANASPLRRRLELMFAELGVPPEAARQLKPWFLATLVAFPPCEFARQAARVAPLDLVVVGALPAGARLVGLETADEQVAAISAIDDRIAEISLIATARHNERRTDVHTTMVEFYLQRRYVALHDVFLEAGLLTPEESDAAIAFEAALRGERDRRLAERALPLIEQGGALVAVGTLHLSGPDGMVERFRRAGYTVTRVW